MTPKFVDPYTKQHLSEDGEGNLYYQDGTQRIVYINHGGVFDFTHTGTRRQEERAHYNDQYRTVQSQCPSLDAIRDAWYDKTRPENLILLQSLGDLSGKRVLLLGNGTSNMELYFVSLGADVVYTDLSIQAAKHMHQLFAASDLAKTGNGSIEFHAVDALHLPFPDSSFDVIYGFAFAHHLDDLRPLISEVCRCLRKGGICRFLDGAYSPLWQFAKGTFLKPLQGYIHKKRGVSPEDLRATKRGGYRREEIASLMGEFGFRSLVFIRTSFFLYVFRRGLGKFFGWSPKVFKRWHSVLMLIKRIDDTVGRTAVMKNNQISLIWGFDK